MRSPRRWRSAPDGTATVVWSAQAGGAFGVYVRRIAPGRAAGPGQSSSPLPRRLRAKTRSPRRSRSPPTGPRPWSGSAATGPTSSSRRAGSPPTARSERPRTSRAPAGTRGSPQVAVAPDGAATVVWKRFDGLHFLIKERRIAADGTLGATQDLSEPAGTRSTRRSRWPPTAPRPSSGAASTAPTRSSRSGGSRRTARRRPASTTSPQPGRTRCSRRSSSAPDGTATVVWVRFDGSNTIVQERRISPGGVPDADRQRPLGDGQGRGGARSSRSARTARRRSSGSASTAPTSSSRAAGSTRPGAPWRAPGPSRPRAGRRGAAGRPSRPTAPRRSSGVASTGSTSSCRGAASPPTARRPPATDSLSAAGPRRRGAAAGERGPGGGLDPLRRRPRHRPGRQPGDPEVPRAVLTPDIAGFRLAAARLRTDRREELPALQLRERDPDGDRDLGRRPGRRSVRPPQHGFLHRRPVAAGRELQILGRVQTLARRRPGGQRRGRQQRGLQSRRRFAVGHRGRGPRQTGGRARRARRSGFPTAFTIGRPILNRRKGTARLPVTLPGAGTLIATGSGVFTKPVAGPGTVTVPVRARGRKSASAEQARKGRAEADRELRAARGPAARPDRAPTVEEGSLARCRSPRAGPRGRRPGPAAWSPRGPPC